MRRVLPWPQRQRQQRRQSYAGAGKVDNAWEDARLPRYRTRRIDDWSSAMHVRPCVILESCHDERSAIPPVNGTPAGMSIGRFVSPSRSAEHCFLISMLLRTLHDLSGRQVRRRLTQSQLQLVQAYMTAPWITGTIIFALDKIPRSTKTWSIPVLQNRSLQVSRATRHQKPWLTLDTERGRTTTLPTSPFRR